MPSTAKVRLARRLSVADRDPLPEAWFPPPEIRELRLRARQRCWLAVLRAQGRNRVQSPLQRHGLRSGRNPFRPAGASLAGETDGTGGHARELEPVGLVCTCLQQMA